MSALLDFFNSCYVWIYSNIGKIIVSVAAVIIVYVAYKLLTKQMARLQHQERLEEGAAFTLKRISQWMAGISVLAVVFAQFGIGIGATAGFLALAGGTIIGFAAINTVGNAFAGMIIMTSRPFRIGDRVFFKGKFVDVLSIDLIYTRMKTLDNVLISVPNQELLNSEIDNYGKKTVVRRNCSITTDYESTADNIEKALLEAASNTKGVLKKPKTYVRITDFKDFAVEYTLYVFISEVKQLQQVDADLKKSILETCKRHEIGISTPSLVKRV